MIKHRALIRLCCEGSCWVIEVEAEVTGLKSTKMIRMLVDTGSTYLILPPSLIEEKGAIRLPFKTKASLANGQEFTAETNVVEVEVEKRKEPLLGVEALEAMGLRVDPTAGILEATRSYTIRAY